MRPRDAFLQLFSGRPPVIGMVHLAPLPGAPRYRGNLEAVLAQAVADAKALVAGGADGLMVENFHDGPLYPETTEPETVAAMTLAAAEVKRAAEGRPIGINVLRNSWKAALAIAAAVGASYVRINVYTEALVTDQGIIAGVAHLAARYRHFLGADQVRILADIYAKHGAPVAARPLAVVARDMTHRAMADAIIVSGEETGAPPRRDELLAVREAVPEWPVLIGSGITEAHADLLREADGVIVGAGVKRDGVAGNPVDPDRVRRLVAAARGAWR